MPLFFGICSSTRWVLLFSGCETRNRNHFSHSQTLFAAHTSTQIFLPSREFSAAAVFCLAARHMFSRLLNKTKFISQLESVRMWCMFVCVCSNLWFYSYKMAQRECVYIILTPGFMHLDAGCTTHAFGVVLGIAHCTR